MLCLRCVRLHTHRVHVRVVHVFLKVSRHEPHTLCTYCVGFPKNYDDNVSTIFLTLVRESCCLCSVLSCCREATFSNYPIVHGLPPPPPSDPDSLECWYLRHKIVLSVSAYGDQTRGNSERYLVAEDATLTAECF